ncbi:MAG: hypothetical protein ACM3PP_01615 [Candidatus Saccharibacteria bacterium]
MKKLYIILAVLVLIALPVGGLYYIYKNTAPAVYKARDLGIRFTNAELTAAQTKLDNILTGKQSQAAFDSRELTALLVEESRKGAPVFDPQVKVNKDDTIEVSGLLAMKRIETMAKNDKSLEDVVFYLGTGHDVPIYARFKGTVDDGHGRLKIMQLNMNDSDLPNGLVSENQGGIVDMLDQELSNAGISSITAKNGLLTIQKAP